MEERREKKIRRSKKTRVLQIFLSVLRNVCIHYSLPLHRTSIRNNKMTEEESSWVTVNWRGNLIAIDFKVEFDDEIAGRSRLDNVERDGRMDKVGGGLGIDKIK